MTTGSSLRTEELLRIAAAVRALRSAPVTHDSDLAGYAERIGSALAACDDINLYSPDRHQRFLAVVEAHELEPDELRVAMALRPLLNP